MSPSTERVAVITVTFNSEDLLPDFISALAPGLCGIEWELVVADNESKDASVATVRRLLPRATVVEMGRNAGYAAGINAAIARAGPHTAVLALNPDVRLTAGCVPELLQAMRQPGVGIAVPRLLDAKGELIRSMRREPTILRALGEAVLGGERAGRRPLLGEMVTAPEMYQYRQTTAWAEGSTQLFSSECYENCGPWDESYFLYSEETEFDLRARDRGFATSYVPSAVAVHLEGGSAGSTRLWPLLVLNRVRLFRRRNGLFPAVFFWLAVLARESSRAILRDQASRAATRALLSPQRLREEPGPHSIR